MPLFRIIDKKRITDEVLLRADKVGTYNEIIFDAKDLPGRYWVGESTVKKYPKGSNGSIMCYYVPMHELQQWPNDKVNNLADSVS